MSELTLEELTAKVNEGIEKHGFFIILVPADHPHEESFAYTVGLNERGMPDLLITGSTGARDMTELLNTVAKQWLSDNRPKYGKLAVPFKEENGAATLWITEIVLVDPIETGDDHTLHLNHRYGPGKYSVAQLCWANGQGRLPSAGGFDDPNYPFKQRIFTPLGE